MHIEEYTFYNHCIKIGNNKICIQLSEKLSEEQLLSYIANWLVGFDIDKENNELLFYKGNKRAGIMTIWFSFPAQETTLTMNSSREEIANEFNRIYNLWKVHQ